jgi:hypothetical protein
MHATKVCRIVFLGTIASRNQDTGSKPRAVFKASPMTPRALEKESRPRGRRFDKIMVLAPPVGFEPTTNGDITHKIPFFLFLNNGRLLNSA